MKTRLLFVAFMVLSVFSVSACTVALSPTLTLNASMNP